MHANVLKDRRRLWRDPCLHILLLVLSLVGYKLFALEMVSRAYMDCAWCLSTKAVTHESKLILLLLTIHLLSCVSRLRFARVTLRLALVAGLVITAVDLVVTHQLWTRLTWYELRQFAGEIGAVSSFVQQLLPSAGKLLAGVLALALVILVFTRYIRDHRSTLHPLFLYLLIAVGVAGCELVERKEYHDLFLQNSIQVFFSQPTSNTPYSKEFAATITASPLAESADCSKAANARRDVILLVFESLSMYHSALFSGINDWMPEFDAVSRTGVRFTNFYANGVTSEQGLVALLTGEPPIAKGTEAKTLFEQFRNPADSVPRMLRGLGYDTVFLTTGNLGFVGKGKWLKDIGFEMIEGHDAPAYTGLKRYQFDAASDDALYARALTQLQEHPSKPVFMTLETVTTHLPNVDPETGTHSQERTYRYADRKLGNFVRSLRSRGFFENGTLIITADHRAMVPMSLRELMLYGDRAFARVPMTVVGTGLVEREETAGFSHTDLLPSLRNALAKGQHCVQADQGVFLPTVTRAPQCIYTNRSYDHNSVFVHCGASDFSIALDGDKTQFVHASSPPPGLLTELHRLRLGKGFH